MPLPRPLLSALARPALHAWPARARWGPAATARGGQPAAAHRPLLTTPARRAKRKGAVKRDLRITQIRYHLQHPRTPRPLRFSRTRHLRHWTIHRAWQRYQDRQRQRRERERERQFSAMAAACEHLRLMDRDGLTPAERVERGVAAAADARDPGRLYRIAMRKDGVWHGVPIEYARIQTETPPRRGWNHAWTR